MKRPKQLKQVYRPDLLLALADYLAVVDNQFDLTIWVDNPNGDLTPAALKKLKGNPKWSTFKSCGATGCALGHAPSVPKLAKMGLKLNTKGDYIEPEYKGKTGFAAGALLFGIPYGVSQWFFDPDRYDESYHKEPKAVAQRIYEFVADPLDESAARDLY